jgi:hypothetical protein
MRGNGDCVGSLLEADQMLAEYILGQVQPYRFLRVQSAYISPGHFLLVLVDRKNKSFGLKEIMMLLFRTECEKLALGRKWRISFQRNIKSSFPQRQYYQHDLATYTSSADLRANIQNRHSFQSPGEQCCELTRSTISAL